MSILIWETYLISSSLVFGFVLVKQLKKIPIHSYFTSSDLHCAVFTWQASPASEHLQFSRSRDLFTQKSNTCLSFTHSLFEILTLSLISTHTITSIWSSWIGNLAGTGTATPETIYISIGRERKRKGCFAASWTVFRGARTFCSQF